MPNRLKYVGYAITFQEVPDEISLVFNISGCPYKCKGCHSTFLWEYSGVYLLDDIENIIDKYADYISCVCFMGGDQNKEDLIEALKICKEKYNLKTCLYTGNDNIEYLKDVLNYLDWVKVGRYDNTLLSENHKEFGVRLASTNQHLFKVMRGLLYSSSRLSDEVN